MRHLKVMVVLASLVAALWIVVPGANASSSGHAKGKGQATATLTVGMAAADTSFAQLYVAMAKGYFAKQGLTIQTKILGGNTLTSLVSGQIDIALQGASAALTAAHNGIDTTLAYSFASTAVSGWVAAAKSGLQSIKECTRMGSLPAGTSLYANMVRYKKASGAGYDIVPFSDLPTELASLISGSIDCAGGTWSLFNSALNAGKVHFIVDSTKPSTVPGDAESGFALPAGGCVTGLTKTFQSRRADIVGFIKAFNQARHWMTSASPLQLAGFLKESSDWDPISREALAQQIIANRTAYSPDTPTQPAGYIPASAWPLVIDTLVNGGLAGTVGDSSYAYSARVDMSYYNAAVVTPLTGAIGPGQKISLAGAKGKLRKITPGIYSITVRDKSSTDNFHLAGVGVDRKTDLGGKSSATWYFTIKSSQGTLAFYSDRSPKKIRGAIVVEPS